MNRLASKRIELTRSACSSSAGRLAGHSDKNMKKMVILGAGATRGASTARKELPPPLLKNLPDIVSERFLSLNNSRDGPRFAIGFNELLDLTGTRTDVEQYLTILHIIGLVSQSINPKLVFMNDNEIGALLDSQRLESVFGDQELANKARLVLTYLRDNKAVALLNYPRNFQSLFQNSLREYMYHALSSCFCTYHAKLFQTLDSDDVVVTFNYDEIADVTLFSIDRLSEKSFAGLPFDGIQFPRDPSPGCKPLRYLKMHGSFNWWTKIADFSTVFYNLTSGSSTRSHIGDTFFPIVLPTRTKEIIYRQYSIYEAHMNQFLSDLRETDQVLLVGKSFLNSDQELNSLVSESRAHRPCTLTIMDPMTSDADFVAYHERLFNGPCMTRHSSLRSIAEDQGPA